jgi:hypothetical protein
LWEHLAFWSFMLRRAALGWSAARDDAWLLPTVGLQDVGSAGKASEVRRLRHAGRLSIGTSARIVGLLPPGLTPGLAPSGSGEEIRPARDARSAVLWDGPITRQETW